MLHGKIAEFIHDSPSEVIEWKVDAHLIWVLIVVHLDHLVEKVLSPVTNAIFFK
jgi:hypothetical protein